MDFNAYIKFLKIVATPQSSNVAAWCFWPGADEKHGVLIVEFKSGGVYGYSDVPNTTAEVLLVAESIGKEINLIVKPFYPHAKLEGVSLTALL